MGNVNPYVPRDLASPLVGVAHFTSSLGETLRSSAQALGKTIEQQGKYNQIINNGADIGAKLASQQISNGSQLATGAANIYSKSEGMLGSVAASQAKMVDSAANAGASALGQLANQAGYLWHRGQYAQQVQNQQLAQAGLANDGYQYSGAADNALDSLKQQMTNTPEQLSDALDSQLTGHAQTLLDSPQYDPQSNPVGRAKLQNEIQQTDNRVRNQARDWSANRQVAIVGEEANGAVDDAKSSMGAMTGDVASKVKLYGGVVANSEKYLNSLRSANMGGRNIPVLGNEFVDKKIKDMVRGTSLAFYQNLATSLPDGAENQLNYAQQIHGLAMQSGVKGSGLPAMDPDDKEKVITLMGKVEKTAADNMERSLFIGTAQDQRKTRVFEMDASNNRDNATFQQSMLNYAQTQSDALAVQHAQTISSNYPDSVKEAKLKRLDAQQTNLNTLTTMAQNNLRAIDNADKSDQRDALHEQNANLRADKALQASATKEQFNQQKGDAAWKLATMKSDLYELSQNPQQNLDAIQKASVKIVDHAHWMADNHYISPEHAGDIVDIALHAGVQAQKAQANPVNFLQGFIQSKIDQIPFIQTKSKQDAAKAQARQGMVTNIRQAAEGLHGIAQQSAQAASVLKPGPQQKFFDENMAKAEATQIGNKTPFTPESRAAFAMSLRSLAIKKFPAVPAATAHSVSSHVSHQAAHHAPGKPGNYFVPPPPATPYFPPAGATEISSEPSPVTEPK